MRKEITVSIVSKSRYSDKEITKNKWNLLKRKGKINGKATENN